MLFAINDNILPPIGATKDEMNPKAMARFVSPAIGDWFVIEAEPMNDGDILFFGYARILDEEYGSFTLAQVLSAGAVIDDEFKPMRMSDAKNIPREGF